MPVLDQKLKMVWESEGGALPKHASLDGRSASERGDRSAGVAAKPRGGAGRRPTPRPRHRAADARVADVRSRPR